MSQKYIDQGITEINAGKLKENSGDFQNAFAHYEKGLEWFGLYVKYEKNDCAKLKIQAKMLEYANHALQLKKKLSPLAMNSEDDKLRTALSSVVLKEKPNVTWDDVVGLEDVKQTLKQTIVLPLKYPSMFKDGKIDPWKGILMYGPPGNGKTFIAKAVATESNSCFFNVRSSDLVSKYVGESARLIKELFEMARKEKPSIIFIDEVDSLCTSRDNASSSDGNRIQNEFLTQMDGVGTSQSGVLVLAATNLPWTLDAAIMRRLEKQVYIPLPDYEARLHYFKKEFSFSGTGKLAKLTDGYSLADLARILKQTKMHLLTKVETSTHFKKNNDVYIPCSPGDPDAIQRDISSFDEDVVRIPEMTLGDVLKSVQEVKPSVSKDYLEKYQKFSGLK
jgi:vacuolar protein-sorting-associated protein 4